MEPFKTPDLYMAAFFQACGAELLGAVAEKGRTWFHFHAESIEPLKHGWYSNLGVVPAQPYAHAIKSLKSLVHEKARKS